MGYVRVGECSWRLHLMYPGAPDTVLFLVRTCWFWLLIQLFIQSACGKAHANEVIAFGTS